MNDPRGSVWRKWDLHVHTPESLVHRYSGVDPWPQFLDELEGLPPEFKVIGINDYLFLDGYKRILAEKAAGRLQNIELLLPVIEVRLDKFGGTNSHLSRVNYHIIFSNELPPDAIEHQFLNALSSKYTLTPQYEHIRTSGSWKAIPTRNSLVDLGKRIIASVPEDQRSKFASPLIEGFNNLCLSLDAINEALDSHYFKGKFVKAVGKTEWADIKWNDQSIADKKTIINGVDLVFTASASVNHWSNAQRHLFNSGVNSRLLDCSDAHSFVGAIDEKDRLGECLTWVKADTTFEGLLQMLIEFDERRFVGELPPQLERVRANPTKYLKSIDIRKKSSASLGEVWFNNSIPLNSGLVAIIGNKGKGKSALSDIIGLLSNTRQSENFTFLSASNFRQPRDNKARHFEAILTLESGGVITKGLEADVDRLQPELVKYIPQSFLESICTQLGRIEESDFDRELKKVIFSHVEGPYRLGQASLDELIAYKAREANEKSSLLKIELHRINEQLASVESKMGPEYKDRIDNLLSRKNAELTAHDQSRPNAVEKPENDPARQDEISATSAAIERAKASLSEVEASIKAAQLRKASIVQLAATADSIGARLDNLNRQVQIFLAESQGDIASLGLAIDSIFSLRLDKTPLIDMRSALFEEQAKLDASLSPASEDSLPRRLATFESAIKALENELDQPNQRYQAYEKALAAWEAKRLAIIGSKQSLDTINYYRSRLEELQLLPEQLQQLQRARREKAFEIHAVIRELARTYKELYAPVNRFVETSRLAKDKFDLNFEVGISDGGFFDKFFEQVGQNSTGSFYGLESGSKALKAILARQDFNEQGGVQQFFDDIMQALQADQRNERPVRIADQLRKGKTPVSLYDFIFAQDYLRPRYALRMGSKELAELSPGERGTLLLVFYLLVDKDDIPLVIDQPEENLDNQTVFELLRPCVKEAKRRRQVFIVTHNPNLAVVCDAEQIIRAELDKANNNTMNYVSGAIESPVINRAIVDILEGTMPAFHNRQDKYSYHSPEQQ